MSDEIYALLYLHDWDPPKEGQVHPWVPGKNVFPEIHAIYTSWQDAEAVRQDMTCPDQYFIRKVRWESEERLKMVRK